MSDPIVLIAIHAKQAEGLLPFYLACIEALDYPKNRIALSICTNNSTDRTMPILRAWADRVMNMPGRYAALAFAHDDVLEQVQAYGSHEWNAERFRVLGRIRQESLDRARLWGCHFYFTADVDNFVRPDTLRTLVALNLPIVAPLLRNADADPGQEGSLYANFHDGVDEAGYLRQTSAYMPIFSQQVRGIIEVPVVHCTYLVRADAIPHLRYDDGTGRHEYVIFSDSARKAGIAQYLDNREVYGWLTFDADSRRAEARMGETQGG